jgi:hypothetical protein
MMLWKQKISHVKQLLPLRNELNIVFADSPGASEVAINRLKLQYPFVDEEFLAFLRLTNGVQIDFFVLFGVGESRFTSIQIAAQRWSFLLNPIEAIPIGEDPVGSCFAIIQDKSVVVVDYTMSDLYQGRVLATSFSEFLGDVLMGEKFPSLFPGSWAAEYENEWTRFLRDQGWL